MESDAAVLSPRRNSGATKLSQVSWLRRAWSTRKRITRRLEWLDAGGVGFGGTLLDGYMKGLCLVTYDADYVD